MYDARETSSFDGKSGLIFAVVTIGVVLAAFFGVLMMPGGKKAAPGTVAEASAEHVILTKLDDRDTRRYVLALNNISPKAVETLNTKAATALEGGASENDLARLVQTTFNEDAGAVLSDLGKIDVRYINEMLDFTKDSLRGLSGTRSKWCKVSTYERMQSQPPTELLELVLSGMDYNSPLYKFGVRGNAIVFEAVAEARKRPARYGRMTRQDQSALEGLAMKIMMNPEVQRLSRLQGMNTSQMTQAMSNTDACKLAIVMIDAVDSLPDATKGRLWAEGFRQINSGEMGRTMSQFGGF